MPRSFRIRPARKDDLDELIALEESTFDYDRISRAQWRRHLCGGSASVLVAEQAGGLPGCVLLFFRRGSGTARLYSLAIRRDARGQGLGAALLESAEEEARARGCGAMRLEVRPDNAAAIALYEKRGYTRGERVAGFYEDGMDAWRYRKTLTSRRGIEDFKDIRGT